MGLVDYDNSRMRAVPPEGEDRVRWKGDDTVRYPDPPLAFVPQEELIRQPVTEFQQSLTAYRAGALDAAHFRVARIQMGIHLQRPPSTRYMIRIKVPYGLLSATQLRTIARHQVSPSTPELHITTRQAIELHDVWPDATGELLEQLTAVGLSTRDAGGNSIRNVVGCPLLGTCPWQTFDAVPTTRCLVRSFLGSAATATLPRKIKVAVSGCSQDCAATRLQDIGLVATHRDGQPGFRVYVGGGIGTTPFVGIPLAHFVPESGIVPLVGVVTTLFNQWGPGAPRHRARLKWLVAEKGEQAFRQRVQASYLRTSAPPVVWTTEDAPVAEPQGHAFPPFSTPAPWTTSLGLDPAWVQRRVWPEQDGRWAMVLAWPGGSLTVRQALLAADWAEIYGNGLLSTTTLQQLVIHGISQTQGPRLIQALRQAEPREVRTTTTVISCPGAPYCNLAITRAGTLSRIVGDLVAEAVQEDASSRVTPLTIRICGCPHACAHVRFAELGLMGGAAKLGHTMIPLYRLWLGGREDRQTPQRGVATVRIPARRVPDAVRRLLGAYADGAQEGESFGAWARRCFIHPDNDEGGSPS